MTTPIEEYPELAEAIGVPALWLKREDLHPYGSHKGRSIPVMIDHYAASGDRKFAVSGSGNASLAAALHIHALNVRSSSDLYELDIFIGNHIAPHKAEKIKALANEHIHVLLKERPLQALTQAVDDGARSLRQSTDDVALEGYAALADELAASHKTGSIFIGTSSGTTAQALAERFLGAKKPFQVHIVQTSSCHPMSDAFESYDGPDEASIADAIVDKTAYRKDRLTPLIKKTGGRGWTVTNEEIEAAQDLVQEYIGLEISTNSALSVAGLIKAVELGAELAQPAICLVCGD